MKRETVTPRAQWSERMEQHGFDIHHFDGEIYWNEGVAYSFTPDQIDQIEDATDELHRLCLQAVDVIVSAYRDGDTRLIGKFDIPEQFWPQVAASWERRDLAVYGRFDLQYDGVNPPKMLEYNAETPTALFEASVLQWDWVTEAKPGHDQFNLIHESLVERWNEVARRPDGSHDLVHFMTGLDNREDFITVDYMRDTCAQSGAPTRMFEILDMNWRDERRELVDEEGRPIRMAFKLYPWEFVMHDGYPEIAAAQAEPVRWLEPEWKMLLSNKAILPVLWELNPGHPNLLKASFNAEAFGPGEDHVVKPKLSREGANIEVVLGGRTVQKTAGEYGDSAVVYQAYAPLPEFDGNRPVIGSWVIGDKARGIGIREEPGYVTTNASRFAPHYMA